MDATSLSKTRILVVEDGPGEREALARLLRLEGYDVVVASDVERALPYLQERIDLVISDLRMRGRTGVELMQAWREVHPATPFIINTAYGDVSSAVAAIKLGAADFLTKPVDPKYLLRLVESCVARQGKSPPYESIPGDTLRGVNRLLGESPAMCRVREQIQRAAATDSTVLLRGESGTGKELAAEAIHAHSRRATAPYVAVNMAAVPDTLVESELFGHVKGAFTGAVVDRIGRFEAAHGGTLFIDEVGDFPIQSQAKLLRVLESRAAQKVGSNSELGVDVRLVAATSRDLESMARDGAFREDLYYRLHVIVINLPPLRDHRSDLPSLIQHFLSSISASIERTPPSLDADLENFLLKHEWPGNVRQLRNCLENMLVLNRGDQLKVDDLPSNLINTSLGELPLSRGAEDFGLRQLTKSVILQTLEQFGENRTRAAQALGISVRTLQRRLKEWSAA